jgi:hypothetical protein
MSQQIIDIGEDANDGTGESLRSAFNAVNENFSEVYAAGPVGSNVVIAGNTVTVTGKLTALSCPALTLFMILVLQATG